MTTVTAVQIASQFPDLTLSGSERAEISSEAMSDGLDVLWLPGLSNNRRNVESIVETAIVFYFGIRALFSPMRPFLEGAGEETGKVTWIAVRKLIARIWEKQTDKAYRTKTEVKLIFELSNGHAAIVLSLPAIQLGGNHSFKELELEVQKILSDLHSDWQEMKRKITNVDVASVGTRDKQIQVIRKVEGEWVVAPENSVMFYLELCEQAGGNSYQTN